MIIQSFPYWQLSELYSWQYKPERAKRIIEFIGSAFSPSEASAAPPRVVCVPQVPTDLLVPHDTWSGESVILKGIARDADDNLSGGTYYWDFGDGTQSPVQTISNADNLSTTHTYTDGAGTLIIARLYVTDAAGETDSDEYRILIKAKTLDVEVNKAIDDGLWWLYTNKQTSGEYFRWRNYYSGGYTGYYNNPTASAVQAFEINGHLESGDRDENPYVDAVSKGLGYLFSRIRSYTIGNTTYGDPDVNGNGIGLTVTEDRQIYELGAVMDALVATGTPDAIAPNGQANVVGRRYQDIVQDMCDMYAWGQTNGGGWQYSWNSGNDNSASQWGAIGMLAAERHFGCKVPQWVKERNLVWLNNSYNSAGYFGYTSRGAYRNGYATGPSGMVQMAFDGIGSSNSRWQACERYIEERWDDFIRSNRDMRYYSYYPLAKALRLALPNEVTHLPNGLDWYGDETRGLARILVDRQNSGGNWSYDGWPYVGQPTAAAWNIIVLTRTLFEKPPVALIHAEPNPGAVGQSIQLDASDSYHVDPAKTIVEYLWDFDASNGVDFDNPDATGITANPTYGALGTYTVSLKVIDDSTPSRFDVGNLDINITIPPHPPTAVVGGPYIAVVGEDVQLDGSGSYDINEPKGDSITAWDWEINFETPYDYAEAYGDIVTIPGFSTPGHHDIALRVTDNTAEVFPTSGSPNLTHAAFGSVTVFKTSITDLAARPKATKCQLTWTHVDVPIYEVLRSETGPNQGFELIGTTDSTYSTYLDYNVVMYQDYWYRIRCELNGETTLSGAVHINSAGRIRNQPPEITSTAVTTAQEGRLYSYDVEAQDPEGTALTYVLDQAPAGMEIDAAEGLITWTPAFADAGLVDVTVRVNDTRLASAGQFFQILVTPRSNTAPVPVPGGPYESMINTTIAFDGSTSSDPEGDPITQYHWNFGDGHEGFGAQANHSYSAPGTYTVTLFVTDDRGATASAETVCQVEAPNRMPNAVIAGPDTGEASVPMAFNALESSDPDGDPLTYTWNLGDSTPAQSGDTVVHTFDAEGTYTVSLAADDGRGGLATTELEVIVSPPNQPPTAAFTTQGDLLGKQDITFDASGSSDPEGPLTAWVWDFGDGSFTSGTLVTHQYQFSGDYTVTLTVTDSAGLEDSIEKVISVAPGYLESLPPEIRLTIEPEVILPGDTVTITVVTTSTLLPDNVNITINGEVVDVVNGQATYTCNDPGELNIVASTQDDEGNPVSAEVDFYVIDSNDTLPPTVVITGPNDGSTITAPTDIIGTVEDDYGVDYYVLAYAPVTDVNPSTLHSDSWVEFYRQDGGVNDDVLGNFDPTLLRNDEYVIRLTAWDVNGNSASTGLGLSVTGNLKLGNFRLEFTDLSVPLAGIPIQVTRVYDTLSANQQGSFGYGWSLGAYDADIRETIPQSGPCGLGTCTPIKVGSRVYLTTPDGRRVGFTFEPEPGPCGLLGCTYYPRFKADPGVYETLEVPESNSNAINVDANGNALIGFLGIAYNPDTYVLTLKNGMKYEYDQFDGLETITDRNSNQVTFGEDGIIHSSGVSIDFVRDSQGRIMQLVDPAGNAVVYGYNTAGDLASVTDQENNTTTFTYYDDPAHYLDEIFDSLDRRPVKSIYDDSGKLIATIDAEGNRVEQDFNVGDFTGTFTDARGNITNYVYDKRGNLLREENPLGGVKQYEYGDPNNPDKETRIVDENKNATAFTYDPRGNMLTKIDALDNTAEWTYNSRNQVLTYKDVIDRLTQYIYDGNGNRIETIDPAGVITYQTFDDQGRRLTKEDAKGNVTTYIYSGYCCGSPETITHPDGGVEIFEYNHFGLKTQHKNQLGHITDYFYDNVGRSSSVKDANGNETFFEWEGAKVTAAFDPLGRRSTDQYNDRGKVVKNVNAAGGETVYTYDGNDNLLSLTDPEGNTTRFEYDIQNRLKRQIDPLSHVSQFSYDDAGNMIESIDRNDRKRTFEYDALNRMTKESWWDGDMVIREIVFEYDDAGRMVFAFDPDSTYTFTHHPHYDRLISVNNAGTPDVPEMTLTYTYDVNGNIKDITDSMGVSVASSYDNMNRLKIRTWTDNTKGLAQVKYSYDKMSQVKTLERLAYQGATPSIVSTSQYHYDDAGRLTGISHLNSNNLPLVEYGYDFDKAGQITSMNHHGESFTYSYDLLGQLTGAERSIGEDEFYTYDSNGNRTSSYFHGSDYLTGVGNQLLTDGEFNYIYDNEGNLIEQQELATGEVTYYTFDYRNRLTEVVKEDFENNVVMQVQFVYDSLNRRIAKITNGTELFIVYNGDLTWADFNGDGANVTRYLFGDKIDDILARYKINEGAVWYMKDHLGTIRDIINQIGSVGAHFDYSSFGIPKTSGVDINLVDRFMFTGREYDQEIGLYYFRARYYSPTLGIFCSRDPLGFGAGDINLQRFVNNIPNNYKDPYGLATMVEYAWLSNKTIGGDRVTASTTAEIGYSDAWEQAGALTGFIQGFAVPHLNFLGRFLEGQRTGATIEQILYRTLSDVNVIRNKLKLTSIFSLSSEIPSGGYYGGYAGGASMLSANFLKVKWDLGLIDVGVGDPFVQFEKFGGYDNGSKLGLERIARMFGFELENFR